MPIVHEAVCPVCEKREPALEVFGRMYDFPLHWVAVNGMHVCSWECVERRAQREIARRQP